VTWADLERRGWSWVVGWSPQNYGGYYAQAWRDYPKPKVVEGRCRYRQCLTEGGRTIEEATTRPMERMEGLCVEEDSRNQKKGG